MRRDIRGGIAAPRTHEDGGSGHWETATRPESQISLTPIREDYARVPIRDGFDWEGSVGRAEDFRAYLVVFRSVRREGADVARLIAHDDRAHEEARKADGFLYYFKGDVAHDRYCLSFCLWESRRHATLAADGVYHQLAVAITEEMYDSYDLERYELHRRGGNLVFEPVRPGVTASHRTG